MNPFALALGRIRAQNRDRHLMVLEGAPGKNIAWQGQSLLHCASNNYLDLAQHPALAEAAAKAAREAGVGSGGARLLGGTSPWHAALEEKLRGYRPLGASLLLNNGFSANFGLVQALGHVLGPVYSDHANHASVMDGLRSLPGPQINARGASRRRGPAFHRYRHGDIQHLQALMRKHGGEHALVISETLFSMDGDFAPLDPILELQKQFGFWLLLDEAHSTLCLPRWLETRLADPRWDKSKILVMGTFGKAFGGFGAYVCGPEEAIRFLINACRPFLFSTSLPPPLLAAAAAAMDIAAAEPWRAEALAQRAANLRRNLRALDFDLGPSQSHIIPVMVGDSAACLQWSLRLRDLGIHAPAVRPPTVPDGKARLRFSLTSAFTEADIDAIARALVQVRGQVSP